MSDQAHELRQLIGRATTPRVSLAAPRMIVVCGGKGGVGTTTIAFNLAAALVREGQRTVLVDAAGQSGGLSTHCQLALGASIHDVIAGRRSVHEALQRGPGGLLILPGHDDPRRDPQLSERQAHRLLDALLDLGKFADLVVLDVGHGAATHAQSLARLADLRLLVTTPDNVAVMDTYALLKQHDAWHGGVIVNQCPDVASGREVQARLALAARRFLGARLQLAGAVLHDRRLSHSVASAQPAVCVHPEVADWFGFETLAEYVIKQPSELARSERRVKVA